MSQGSGRFGPVTLTCLVVAGMIGAGVFTTSGFTIAALGSPARVLAAWAIGGLIALCGAISYAGLVRRIPESGGEYIFLARGMHPFFGFLAGWISLTAGFSGPVAISALTLEAYALPLGTTLLPPKGLALAVILLCGIGHAFQVNLSARLQNLVVLLKVVVLVLISAMAASVVRSHPWHWESLESPPAGTWPVTVAFAQQLVWISLSYLGFNAAVYLASESRDPRRTVPSAVITGTVLVTVLYLLLNLIFVTAAPATTIANQPDVARIAAAALDTGGVEVASLSAQPHAAAPQAAALPWWTSSFRLEGILRIAVILAMFTSVAGNVMAGPRVYSRMAGDGLFPRYFRSDDGHHPGAVLLQTALAVVFVLSSSIAGLIDYLGTTLSLCSVLAVVTLFLPLRSPSRSTGEEPLSSGPGWACRICAAVYASVTLVLILLKSIDAPDKLTWTGITFGAGYLIWWVSGLYKTAGR
ncbi:MAG: amino acid permease [Planctomycetaceae bacterium]|nr:amino acid permease [Planctomycetaceae bacterium]